MAILNLQTPGVYIDEERSRTAKSAQDYKHLVQLVQGDSLPNECNRVWNNPSNYAQVASYNGLNKFRDLNPNVQLVFPPIL